MLAGAYSAMTMSAKATAAWIGSFFVLALAIFAWYAYAANGHGLRKRFRTSESDGSSEPLQSSRPPFSRTGI
jgi:hypothetical protein